jgi:DNA-binding IclR family transcriptional regulator
MVALDRLKGLFLEIPDTQLSLAEATHIAGLDPQLCRQLLSALVDVRFLTHDPDGAYRRRPHLFGDEPLPLA